MEGTDKKKRPVKLEHCIAVTTAGDKARMQEIAVKEGRRDILHITGKATNINVQPAKNPGANSLAGKETVWIKGSFQAINLLTDTKHISGQLILPDSVSAYISSQDLSVKNPFEVDVLITVVRAPKSITGYKYEATIQLPEDVGVAQATMEVNSEEGESPIATSSESGEE